MSSQTSAGGNLLQRLTSLPSETYLGLLGYVFIGTAAVLVPSVMPFITEEYTNAGITLAAIALIFPARSVGAIVGNVFAGVGSDLVGAQRLVWLSALGLALALFLTAISQMWLLFVTGFVFVSATQGALSTGINTMIADANRKARARA
ncbi:MAG: MFS transporter [Caldilineaceae bacterium]